VELRPKTNFVHSKAVRKPLVAIILSILNLCACFTVVTYQEYRYGVGPSPKGGGGWSWLDPLEICHCVWQNVNNRNAGLISVNLSVFKYRYWVVLEFADGLNLVICNTLFTKQEAKF